MELGFSPSKQTQRMGSLKQEARRAATTVSRHATTLDLPAMKISQMTDCIPECAHALSVSKRRIMFYVLQCVYIVVT